MKLYQLTDLLVLILLLMSPALAILLLAAIL